MSPWTMWTPPLAVTCLLMACSTRQQLHQLMAAQPLQLYPAYCLACTTGACSALTTQAEVLPAQQKHSGLIGKGQSCSLLPLQTTQSLTSQSCSQATTPAMTLTLCCRATLSSTTRR